MEGKKKYVVIALLLLLGFGAISFAGGGEDELDPMNDNTSDVDKDGVMLGIVTMEDVIETMLGVEIVDENDIAEDMQLLAEMKD